jgi:hypothetical protein
VLQRGGEQRGELRADEKKEDVRNPSAARTPSQRSCIGTSSACEDGGGDRGDARCDICARRKRRTPVSVTRVGLEVSERHYEVGALLRRSD